MLMIKNRSCHLTIREEETSTHTHSAIQHVVVAKVPFLLHGALPRPVKNTAHRPLWAGGQQFEKKVFFPHFFGVFCGFSEEIIVFVLHYDLKCIFQDN